MARRVSNGKMAVTTVAAWAIGILLFFPILWTGLAAFKTEADAYTMPQNVLTSGWTTENFGIVQERSNYLRYALNSAILSVVSTLLGLLLAVPAAWSMAFMPTKRTKDTLLWMLSTKMMPPAGALIPIYLILNRNGLIFKDWGFVDLRSYSLIDTYTGLIPIMLLLNLPIVVWMLYTYFKEIPGEILEAARMDGAGLWHELTRVLAPMALPGIASTFLLAVILAWNEAFWTLNLTNKVAAPLSFFISEYSSPEGQFWAKLSAASTMAIAPILILGWFSQRQLVRGLTFGAVK